MTKKVYKEFFCVITPIKLSSAYINRHYPDIKEFQINALIIKSSGLSVHVALAKIYIFNAFPRALCFPERRLPLLI